MFYANMGSDGQDPGPNDPNTQMQHSARQPPCRNSNQTRIISLLAELIYHFRGEKGKL